ncbi:TPA: fimbrial protein [Yersinia enterocolitica]|uniref:fimbrial protein n=1 Tax=Yersinia enterocolitica TaxID=630 RepID=UPI001E658DA2|nr:fimbrial protein [Yersinia enterocolitica]MCF3930496.1 fimbrial protein [Yersinia enterocolitica]
MSGITAADGGGGKSFPLTVSGINAGDIIDAYTNVKNGDSLNLIIIPNPNVLTVIPIYQCHSGASINKDSSHKSSIDGE